jgi:hypothetical protein
LDRPLHLPRRLRLQARQTLYLADTPTHRGVSVVGVRNRAPGWSRTHGCVRRVLAGWAARQYGPTCSKGARLGSPCSGRRRSAYAATLIGRRRSGMGDRRPAGDHLARFGNAHRVVSGISLPQAFQRRWISDVPILHQSSKIGLASVRGHPGTSLQGSSSQPEGRRASDYGHHADNFLEILADLHVNL